MGKLYEEKNKNHRQEENAYILYETISEYFANTVCMSQTLRDRVYLYYCEMNAGKQREEEARIFIAVAKSLAGYHKVLRQMNCEAWISVVDGDYILRFYTGFENVRVTINEKGRFEINIIVTNPDSQGPERAA